MFRSLVRLLNRHHRLLSAVLVMALGAAIAGPPCAHTATIGLTGEEAALHAKQEKEPDPTTSPLPPTQLLISTALFTLGAAIFLAARKYRAFIFLQNYRV